MALRAASLANFTFSQSLFLLFICSCDNADCKSKPSSHPVLLYEEICINDQYVIQQNSVSAT
jgi:hypothetical protein